MTFISRVELTHLTDVELNELFDLIASEVLHAKQGSVEWHSAMLSLDNMRYERQRRRDMRRVKPCGPGGPGF